MAVPAGTERIVKRNPATLELVGELDCTPIDDIPIIIQKVSRPGGMGGQAAGRAQRTLKRLQEHVSSNIDGIARVVCQETGKPRGGDQRRPDERPQRHHVLDRGMPSLFRPGASASEACPS